MNGYEKGRHQDRKSAKSLGRAGDREQREPDSRFDMRNPLVVRIPGQLVELVGGASPMGLR